MFWKKLKCKIWSFFWFLLIPVFFACLIEYYLVKFNVFLEIAPWRLLLLIAVCAFILLSIKNRLPFWRDNDVEEIENKKKIMKEGRVILSRLEKHLKKEDKLSGKEDEEKEETTTQHIKKCLDLLKSGLDEKDQRKIKDAMEKVKGAPYASKIFPSSNSTLELIKVFGTAIVFAILLRSFIVEPFKIPTASMIPTLQIGDHIFVSKFAYGITIPYMQGKKYFWKMPERGEVIVFRPPHDPEKDFIKRVIGKPGDELEIRNSVLYINGIAIPRCKIGALEYQDRDQETSQWTSKRGVFFLEKLGKKYYIVINNPSLDSSWGSEVVPDGTLYVMGDNRDNSYDSRAWGGVPFENIKGEGMIIWWSNGPGPSLRIGRMGRMINSLLSIEPSVADKLKACKEKLKSAPTVSN